MTTGIAHEINNPMNFISGGIHAISTLKNELLKLDEKRSQEKAALYEQMDKIMENTLPYYLKQENPGRYEDLLL